MSTKKKVYPRGAEHLRMDQRFCNPIESVDDLYNLKRDRADVMAKLVDIISKIDDAVEKRALNLAHDYLKDEMALIDIFLKKMSDWDNPHVQAWISMENRIKSLESKIDDMEESARAQDAMERIYG
jgi:hypothetical protein